MFNTYYYSGVAFSHPFLLKIRCFEVKLIRLIFRIWDANVKKSLNKWKGTQMTQ